MGLNRGGWAKRRPGYLESGVMIRSINKWEQCANLNLHINKDDEIETVFYVNKRLIHLPLLILVRALCDWNDLEIFNEFMQTMTDEKNYISALKRMLSDVTNRNQMRNQNDALKFIGENFRVLGHCPKWFTDLEVAKYYLDNFCLIHLNDGQDKVRLLALMSRKVFRLAYKRSMVDNPDSPENHEVLLPGHLFQVR